MIATYLLIPARLLLTFISVTVFQEVGMASDPAVHTHKAGNKESSLPTLAAVEFEKSLFAGGLSVDEDEFYTVPKDAAATATPGTLLKVERDTNVSAYTVPPSTALSRILYQSRDLKGNAVPASAYVLWPYMPRTQPDGYPVVAWAHGSSGLFRNWAPSHIKNLWQHFIAPYPLAFQGYVVVAPDYVGLGVDRDAAGEFLVHQFAANPAHANDVFYAVEAAQAAFSELSAQFVAMGHSQGGGAAWGAAQRQALEPVDGYLGAVSISPVTRVLDLPENGNPLIPVLGAFMIPGISSVFPAFDPLDILTPIGAERFKTYSDIGGGIPTGVELLVGIELLRRDWRDNQYVKAYVDMTANGGKQISGPLLVIQGELDPNMNATVTSTAVEHTCKRFPESQMEYVLLPGISHVPAVYSTQRLWLDWIAARFAGAVVEKGCQRSVATLARPSTSYQKEMNWFIQLATQPYEMV